MLKLHRKNTQEISYPQNLDLQERLAPILTYKLGLSIGLLLGITFILNILQELLPHLNTQFLEPILIATSSPFVSFFIGLLLSAMFQYLPFTLLVILFLVNAQVLTMYSAVYMVLGINIGTSSTTTIVSLEYVKRKKHFKKAISASVNQDAIYILASLFVIIIDLLTDFISFSLQYFHVDYSHEPKSIFRLVSLFDFTPWQDSAWLTVFFIIGCIGVWFCLHYAFDYLTQTWGSGLVAELGQRTAHSDTSLILKGLKVGVLVPSNLFVAKQVIPAVISYKIPLEKVVVLLAGINLGMTTFALIWVGLYPSAENIYLVAIHILINIGGLTFVLIPWIRLSVAFYTKRLVRKMLKNRLFGLGYILTAFFVIPFLLLLGSKDWVKVKTYHIIQQPCNVLVYPMQNTRTITESKKIYYKQVNKLRSDTQIQPYLLTYPLHIQKKEEVLFINQQPWMLASQGYCWEGTDKIGRFIICIDSISTKKLRENQRYRTDTTYFFSKKYLFATQKEATNWLIKLEVDISRKLVKKYTICSQTDLLYQESMISLF